jgi:CBS domain containing-hemolysin-like protein
MESPSFGSSFLGLLGIVALVLVNAYFVATEFSLVAVRRTQIDLWAAEGRRGAESAKKAISNLDDAIAATQLGITVASLGLGWIGEPTIAGIIEPLLGAVGWASAVTVHTLALTLGFALITFIHVVAGELAPKALALDYPGRVALFCAGPLLVFGRMFRVILIVMNGAGNAIVRPFGVKPADGTSAAHSSDELSMLVSESRAAGKILPYAGRILGNVFRLSGTRVRDVMVPRDEVTAVPIGIDPENLLDLLRESGYTRLPVYRTTLDQIVGILHTKDLFHLYAKQRVVVMEDATRPASEMDPDLLVVDALRAFRHGRRHLAIVRDHDGRVIGVCTLEDVLEEIVGEIEDEHDMPTPAGSE